MVWHHGSLLKLSRFGVQGRLFLFSEEFCVWTFNILGLRIVGFFKIVIQFLLVYLRVAFSVQYYSQFTLMIFLIVYHLVFNSLCLQMMEHYGLGLMMLICCIAEFQRAFNVGWSSDWGLRFVGVWWHFIFSKRKVLYEPHFFVVGVGSSDSLPVFLVAPFTPILVFSD